MPAPITASYPYSHDSSFIPVKFIPYHPVKRDSGKKTVVTIVSIFMISFCQIHLGDGMIIVQGKGTRILSSCENGIWSNQTYLTTSHNASEKVRVYKENIQGIDDIALISDGMYQLPMDDRQLDAIFCNLDADEELEEGMDDKAIIALRRKNG